MMTSYIKNRITTNQNAGIRTLLLKRCCTVAQFWELFKAFGTSENVFEESAWDKKFHPTPQFHAVLEMVPYQAKCHTSLEGLCFAPAVPTASFTCNLLCKSRM